MSLSPLGAIASNSSMIIAGAFFTASSKAAGKDRKCHVLNVLVGSRGGAFV